MKGDIEKEFEYMNAVIKNTSTADLIAELEKRVPNCEDCTQTVRYLNVAYKCENCIGRGVKLRNNFEAKP